MKVTDDIKYIGVNDHEVDLFEGQFEVPLGMAYNSYVIKDEKIAVMDTVDQNFGDEWLQNLKSEIGDAKVDFLVVHHMEPDHSANIAKFAAAYPEAKIVSSLPAFAMMKNFFGTDFADRRVIVKEGDTLALGRHRRDLITKAQSLDDFALGCVLTSVSVWQKNQASSALDKTVIIR